MVILGETRIWLQPVVKNVDISLSVGSIWKGSIEPGLNYQHTESFIRFYVLVSNKIDISYFYMSLVIVFNVKWYPRNRSK